MTDESSDVTGKSPADDAAPVGTSTGAGDLLISFRTHINRIVRDLAVACLSVDRNRVLPPPPQAELKYRLRDSVVHRMESLHYHLRLLVGAQLGTLDALEHNFALRHDNDYLLRCVQDQYFLFDDLIFSSCSALDYLSNLLGLFYLRDQDTGWRRLSKAARARGNPMNPLRIASEIVRIDRDVAGSLYDYRSGLIHEFADSSGFESSWGFSQEKGPSPVTFLVRMPKGLAKRFRPLKQRADIGDMNLIDACFFIVGAVLDAIDTLTVKCSEDMPSIARDPWEGSNPQASRPPTP